MTERDPEWTHDDRAVVLALLAERRDQCPGCGHPVSECWDPDTRNTWGVEQAVCQACVVAEATRDNMAEASKPPRGVHIWTVRNT